jgi:hypothetical protein
MADDGQRTTKGIVATIGEGKEGIQGKEKFIPVPTDDWITCMTKNVCIFYIQGWTQSLLPFSLYHLENLGIQT